MTPTKDGPATKTHDDRAAGSPIVRVIAALLAELWSMVFFTLFSPRTNDHTARDRAENARRDEGGVTPLSDVLTSAETPLETLPPGRHLGRRTREGGAQGLEDDVSDEFLKQLEQRTQQVKITLANLEAEKIRIEAQIGKLQPLVPQYDALIEAERQLTQANIAFETVEETPAPVEEPQESSGWSSDAPGGGEQQSAGWSGSWNS